MEEASTPFEDLAGDLYRQRAEPEPPRRVQTTSFSVRLTVPQVDLLGHLADYLGMKRATLAASLLGVALESFVIDLLEKPTDPEEHRELIQQLREAGVEVDEETGDVAFLRVVR